MLATHSIKVLLCALLAACAAASRQLHAQDIPIYYKGFYIVNQSNKNVTAAFYAYVANGLNNVQLVLRGRWAPHVAPTQVEHIAGCGDGTG